MTHSFCHLEWCPYRFIFSLRHFTSKDWAMHYLILGTLQEIQFTFVHNRQCKYVRCGWNLGKLNASWIQNKWVTRASPCNLQPHSASNCYLLLTYRWFVWNEGVFSVWLSTGRCLKCFSFCHIRHHWCLQNGQEVNVVRQQSNLVPF